jgi:methylisocitrate lyase
MTTLKQLVSGNDIVVAPFVSCAMSAKLAEGAGFKALYLGGGGMGYLKAVTEANLSLVDMVQAGIDIRTATPLPLILDGACGWGDPMHLHRTINMAETAGFSAIEIEDQILPKRAHHHAGKEHAIPMELMVAKVEEAVAARRDPNFLIIARTNVGDGPLDASLRRAEAYKKAGADMLFVFSRKDEHTRPILESLPKPLMHMARPGGGIAKMELPLGELQKLGVRLLVDAMTPVLVMHHALRQCYENIAKHRGEPMVTDFRAEIDALHDTIGLEQMLEIERRTVEK